MKTSEIDRLLERAPRMPKNRMPGHPISIAGKVDMVHLCSCWSCQITDIQYESRFAYEVAIEPKKDQPYLRYQGENVVGVYVHVAVSRSEFEASDPKNIKEKEESDIFDDDKQDSNIRLPFRIDQVSPNLIRRYGESLFRDIPKRVDPEPRPAIEHFDGDEIRKLLIEHNKRNPQLLNETSATVAGSVNKIPPNPPVTKPSRPRVISCDEEEVKMKIGFTINGLGKISFHDLTDDKLVEVELPIEGFLVMRPVRSELKIIFDVKGFKGRKFVLSVSEWQALKYTPGNGIEIKTRMIDR